MNRRTRSRGFTLVEVAIVLLVLGTLAGAALVPLGERFEERRRESTRQRLADVHRALIGHLATRGVLPCPLPVDGSGSGVAHEPGPSGDGMREARPCTLGQGHVPAVALGVAGPIDTDGALLDDWGRPLRYAVSLASSGRAGEADAPDWVTAGEPARVGLRHLDADLVLCRAARADDCPRAERRAEAIAFVAFSTGATPEPHEAERENLDGDRTYTVAPPSAAVGHRFDDQLVWASRDELAYWLLRAGWLP